MYSKSEARAENFPLSNDLLHNENWIEDFIRLASEHVEHGKLRTKFFKFEGFFPRSFSYD